MEQTYSVKMAEQPVRGKQLGGVLPLTVVAPGANMTVCAIRGRDDTRRMLADLGFVEGSTVCLVCQNHGNVIVNIKGARVALDQKLAARVMVA